MNANRIFLVIDKDGKMQDELEGIAKAFTDFYSNVLGSSNIERDHVNGELIKKRAVLIYNMGLTLIQPVIAREIKKALRYIPGDKSPGPDGYGSQFFKDAWDIVG